jgi:hypothetical protein
LGVMTRMTCAFRPFSPLDGQDQAAGRQVAEPLLPGRPERVGEPIDHCAELAVRVALDDRLSLGTASKAACNRLSSRWSIKTAGRATSR